MKIGTVEERKGVGGFQAESTCLWRGPARESGLGAGRVTRTATVRPSQAHSSGLCTNVKKSELSSSLMSSAIHDKQW
jgi:hypothetical protein